MLKRLFTALVCLVTALAVALPAGSSDSLVPRSYIDIYKQEIHAALTGERDSALARFSAKIEQDAGLPPLLGDSFTEYLAPAELYGELNKSYSLLPLSTWREYWGSANITFSSGEVLDLTNGESIKSGTVLIYGHRYFTAEDTTAVVRVYASNSALFDGTLKTENAEYPPEYHFIDVPPEYWASSQVADLLALGIVAPEGTGGYYFKPSLVVTRKQLVTLFANYEKIDNAAYTSRVFKDVEPEAWFGPACAWAAEAGIVSGSDGNFFPDNNLTREQLAVFIKNYAAYRGAELKQSDAFPDFEDLRDASEWAREAVNWAGAANLVAGKVSGSHQYFPKSTAVRSEMCGIMLNYIRSEGEALPAAAPPEPEAVAVLPGDEITATATDFSEPAAQIS